MAEEEEKEEEELDLKEMRCRLMKVAC